MATVQPSAGGLPTSRAQQGMTSSPGDIYGNLLISQAMPRYGSLAKSGRTFLASAAGVTLSASATTATGLILWNSSANTTGVGFDLYILKVWGDVIATSASLTGIFIGKFIQSTTPTGTTAAVQTSGYLSANSNAGIGYTAATIANAPTSIVPLAHNTAAIAVTGEDPGFYYDFEGLLVVPPGYGIAFYGNAASAASAVNLGISWAEGPL